ncbi:MAG TPA: polysaccharide deacetylase family protein [Spirochaetota bacterium]|nr:polysaccharide deacetylase family protein [Spirochaetota bacterium]
MKIILNTLAVISILLIIYIVIPHICKKIIRYKFLNAIHKSKDIYLTFDDGPDPESTPLIIDALKQHGFTATFFITGTNGEQYPELVNLIKYSGNTIGMHGYNHIHPWKTGPLTTIKDIRRMKIYFHKNNPGVNLYRPPYGKYNIVSLLYYLSGYTRSVFWDIDPEDYNSTDPYAAATDIIKLIKPGSVILLHDGRDNIEKQSPSVITVSIVQSIIQFAIVNNLNISGIR